MLSNRCYSGVSAIAIALVLCYSTMCSKFEQTTVICDLCSTTFGIIAMFGIRVNISESWITDRDFSKVT
jgi:hypothetical protein